MSQFSFMEATGGVVVEASLLQIENEPDFTRDENPFAFKPHEVSRIINANNFRAFQQLGVEY